MKEKKLDKNSKVEVVIGTGPLGLAVVRELLAKDKKVRVVNRSGKADVPANVEIKAGDIVNSESAQEACRSAGSIYLCAKPPYTEWTDKFEPIMDGAIEAAAGTKAKLIYGDNLYAYGPFTGAVTEDFPDAATGPKGKARARIAAKLLAAHKAGKVRAAIGRASDFYGLGVTESSLGERVFGFALAGKAASVLGNPDVPHTYTYIDDFAKGLVTLGEHDEALGRIWLVPSAETVTTRAFITMVFEELGKPAKIQAVPRWLISLLGIFDPTMRELPEVMYQSEQPFVVDHGRYERAFGASTTPHREAIRRTLDWYRQKAG
jgi:nucleoside-diphosphate-sugar epimerase